MSKELAIRTLHWTLGAVIFLESLIVALSYKEVVAGGRIGLPSWALLLLAVAEMMTAGLFLIPQTIRIGSYSLILIFLLAVIIHVLHGQYNVGALFIYGAAVVAVKSNPGETAT